MLAQVVEGAGTPGAGIAHTRDADLRALANLDRRTLARDFLSGLAWLHSRNIGWLWWNSQGHSPSGLDPSPFFPHQSTATSSRRMC